MVANYQNLMTGGYSREINIDVYLCKPEVCFGYHKENLIIKIGLVIYWNISNQQFFFLVLGRDMSNLLEMLLYPRGATIIIAPPPYHHAHHVSISNDQWHEHMIIDHLLSLK